VLGELFYGTWPDKDGRGETKLTVEQVSHHPPITAYYITNTSKHLVLQGHNAQKTSFSSGSIFVKQIGHAILTYHPPGKEAEKFLITLPKLRIDGIWYGAPYVELTDNGFIQSSTGFLSTIEYKGKGYFSGKAHSIKATFGPSSDPANPSITIEGQWDTITKATSSYAPKYAKTGSVFTDVTTPKEEVTVAPIDQQGEWETRKLWEKVAAGIRSGDFEAASKDKTRIEVGNHRNVLFKMARLTQRNYRTNNGRGGEMKRRLEHPGSFATLYTSTKTQIVGCSLSFSSILILLCTDSVLVSMFDEAAVAPTEDCYVFKTTSGTSGPR